MSVEFLLLIFSFSTQQKPKKKATGRSFPICQLPEIFDRQRVLRLYCFKTFSRFCGPVLSVIDQRAMQIPTASTEA